MGSTVKFQDQEWTGAFARLAGPLAESLARRMLVSGGQIMRDEAKQRASVSHAETTFEYNSGGSSASSPRPGTLADSIYLAFNGKLSDSTHFTYSISWNNNIAWWGRLREFGYITKYAVYKTEDGMFHTNKKIVLKTPRPMPAKPFLAPSFDATLSEVRHAMMARGRVEYPLLLKGG